MKKPKPYPKALDTPLPPSASQAEHARLINQKIALLFDHYYLDQGQLVDWATLSVLLAHEHFRGFSIPKTTGKKEEWSLDRKVQLLSTIESLTRKGMSISAACGELKKRQPFKEWKAGARTLRRQYHACPKSLPNLALFDRLAKASPEEFRAYKGEIDQAKARFSWDTAAEIKKRVR